MSSDCATICDEISRLAPAGNAAAPASATRMNSLRSTTPRQISRASVEDAHVALQRVALHRDLAEALDEGDELLGCRAGRRAGRGHNVFLDHHRSPVIRAELQCYLTDSLSLLT